MRYTYPYEVHIHLWGTRTPLRYTYTNEVHVHIWGTRTHMRYMYTYKVHVHLRSTPTPMRYTYSYKVHTLTHTPTPTSISIPTSTSIPIPHIYMYIQTQHKSNFESKLFCGLNLSTQLFPLFQTLLIVQFKFVRGKTRVIYLLMENSLKWPKLGNFNIFFYWNTP